MRLLTALLLLLTQQVLHAGVHDDWLSVYRITQQHPVYRSHEAIQRPQGTVQLLMALHFVDPAGTLARDCVWYQLPSEDTLGLLKIIRTTQECRDWQASPHWEIPEIRSLAFKLSAQALSFEYTTKDAQLKVEKFKLLNLPSTATPERFESSVPQRSQRGVFFLAPNLRTEKLQLSRPALAAGRECSFAEGTCQLCAQGVIKVRDPDRPRFKCGVDRCGEKNELACWRGIEWKREREVPTCRRDPWHLYCQQGLRLECEGELGFCR